MAKGWRMWVISLLTIMLLPLLSAAPLDIAGDIKKEDVKADSCFLAAVRERGSSSAKSQVVLNVINCEFTYGVWQYFCSIVPLVIEAKGMSTAETNKNIRAIEDFIATIQTIEDELNFFSDGRGNAAKNNLSGDDRSFEVITRLINFFSEDEKKLFEIITRAIMHFYRVWHTEFRNPDFQAIMLFYRIWNTHFKSTYDDFKIAGALRSSRSSLQPSFDEIKSKLDAHEQATTNCRTGNCDAEKIEAITKASKFHHDNIKKTGRVSSVFQQSFPILKKTVDSVAEKALVAEKAKLAKISGYVSLGCWKDTPNRAIATFEGNYQDRKNAVELCFEVGKSKGYPAFAVQDGGQCWASSTALETYKKYGAASNCANGKGGAWANDVYKITGSLPPGGAPGAAPAYLFVPGFEKCLGTKSEGLYSVWCFPFEKPAACNPTSWEKLMTLQKEPKERFSSCEPTNVQAASANINNATEMPNIGKLFQGYDIMKGNPLPVEPLPVDPGFREPIFEASYSGSLTADRRYREPDGTAISSCIGDCSLKFSSTEISGAKSYQESLARKVGFSVGASIWGWGGKFSASYGYKEVAEKTSSASNLFTLSSASCCAYSAELLTYNRPSLSQNFIDGVFSLTEKYDEIIYFDFIQAFGTHFIENARMGSLYGEQSEISKSAWTTMLEKGIDISLSAELSAPFWVTASSDVSQNDNVKNAEIFASKATKQKVFTMGATPPDDGKEGTWLQKTISEPAPIELTLGGSLLDLLEHDDIKAKVSTAVKANLKQALDDYCDVLHKSGEAKTCSSPGADPAFPSPDVVFPDPKKYYVIENTVYPGSRIQGNAAKECGECTTQSHGSTRQNWRFEPVGQAYYIYNQEARYYRLCSAKWGKNNFCLYAGRLYDDQKWRLTPVGGNKVRITNVDNNFKLGQWASGECGTGDWAQTDDQIWELKEVE